MVKRLCGSISQQVFLNDLSLDLIFSLTYINNHAVNVSSPVKPFLDGTSIFRIISNVNVSLQVLSNYLSTIQDWTFCRKMSFNPDPTKPAKEVIFSSKRTKDLHPPLRFNDYQINVEKSHKHLGLIFDEKFTFAEHVREAIVKAERGIGIIQPSV